MKRVQDFYGEYEKFAKNIKYLREKRGYTRYSLKQILTSNKETIKRLEDTEGKSSTAQLLLRTFNFFEADAINEGIITPEEARRIREIFEDFSSDNSEGTKKFLKFLSNEFKIRDVSMSEVADKLGLSVSHFQKYLSGGINISKYVVREFRRVWEQDIKYRRYICRPRYKHQVDQLREKLKGYGYTVEELAEELECSEQDIQTALEGRDVRCLNIRQRLKHILRREQRLEKFREELLTPYYTHNSNGGER